jgi:general secretion pathway protein G
MKSRAVVIIQWSCLAIPFFALLTALTLAPNNDTFLFRFDLALLVLAMAWIAVVMIFRRKYMLSLKFPLGLVGVSLLGFVSTPVYLCYDCGKTRHVAANAQIHVLSMALENYKHDVGTYPSTEQGLAALRTGPELVWGWDGPYLMKDVPNDPWGHPYIYRFPGKNLGKPVIGSYGADGVPGGDGRDADIFMELPAAY